MDQRRDMFTWLLFGMLLVFLKKKKKKTTLGSTKLNPRKLANSKYYFFSHHNPLSNQTILAPGAYQRPSFEHHLGDMSGSNGHSLSLDLTT